MQGKLTSSKRRRSKIYNLDAILSVEDRINSKRGTKFRQMGNPTFKRFYNY
ncbi:MAG TPA: virulence RhuM family protein [Candidatus Sphingobacterium stercoripullorum]|uniref:Virulence RhuM family protein n=1 Tax=Candidatus Sphingobacterium stercoripullorum TaxID=2838759 RepID=A0A9D1WA52_9SPHI|nr:virulence RhuM family protein [Candidatus Sphingobacterium stercoripullorum]